jgi:hypothetical protein
MLRCDSASGCWLPTLTPRAFAAYKPGTTVGASISLSAPFGRTMGRLINLG